MFMLSFGALSNGPPAFWKLAPCSPGNLQKTIREAFPELFADIGRQMSEAVPPDGFGNGEAHVGEGRGCNLNQNCSRF